MSESHKTGIICIPTDQDSLYIFLSLFFCMQTFMFCSGSMCQVIKLFNQLIKKVKLDPHKK